MKRIILAAGGTGGHFYPAFSLALKLKEEGWQPLFIIKKNDISLETLKENEIPFIEIDMISFPRGLNPFSYFSFFLKLISSFFYCVRIIKDFAPNSVLGTGSYVAFPAILAAKTKKVKTYIHESNSAMGISNFLSGFFADKIFLGLPLKDNSFPKKTILTGTPLRKMFSQIPEKQEARKILGLNETDFYILVFGGSQGARNLNEAFYKTLLDFSYEKKKINFIQITGKANFEELKEKYEKAELLKNNLILPYYENMPVLYSAADAVIARSGSGTICELMATKKPAILVPLKIATGDHQTFNAIQLSIHGCALIVKDDEMLKNNLKKSIDKFFSQNNLSAMSKSYDRLNIPYGNNAMENILNFFNHK